MTETNHITIIGGGLAGCEAAWQAAQTGVCVTLLEMKPERYSPAHHSDRLGELVCSNSLRGIGLQGAVGCLKEEMRRCGSLIMQAADATTVPAGGALAVNRDEFADYITQQIEQHPLITTKRQEITSIPKQGRVIIASGPLTSEALSLEVARLTGSDHLYFYDAIAPIIEADSIDMEIVWRAARYDKGGADYLNCPMSEEQYRQFIAALLTAETVPYHNFEKAIHFEGCMPIEVLASRGEQTLAFAAMKPVGLPDPRTGKPPYAVVQLRMEDKQGQLFNMVGFQTKLTYPEQKRIFRTIPGLEKAEFARYGGMHRNTFINAPTCLDKNQQLKNDPRIVFAGQITGVEGYVESAASGFLAGLTVARQLQEKSVLLPPSTTGFGALLTHLTESDAENFQPANVNYGLFPLLENRKRKRSERRLAMAERALTDLADWWQAVQGEER
jgi:methylenetetrahydrofolate--tRNA-(uracil-5-)-methyltransferase